MSVLDKATGLPELPGGHIWRVKPDKLQIIEQVPAGEWSEWKVRDEYDGFSMFYYETESQERDRTIYVTTGVGPFKKTEPQVQSFAVWRYRRGAKDVVVAETKFGERAIKRVKDGSEQVRTSGGHPYYHSSSQWVATYKDVEVVIKEDPITSANLCERAEALFDKWQTAGDYPPKSLK